MKNTIVRLFWIAVLVISCGIAQADQVFLDDVIVDGSECVGQDCVNGESFGFDTIRLKENNLRIHFQDTSTSASFPTNDWRIIINDSSNGGSNYFGIEDSNAGRIVFKIEAGAPANSLVVEDGGRVGIGTATPVVEVHIKDGDTPTVRLEQDGSSGFTAQTWDLAGNGANFFIRDVTNGSQLPFKIQPGADSNALYIGSTNMIGMGTSNPATHLHISNNGYVTLRLHNTQFQGWDLTNAGNGTFRINNDDGDNQELTLDADGNLTIDGYITAGASGSSIPDYVFEDDYNLMPLQELKQYINEQKHLPGVLSAQEISETGTINMSEMQLTLLKKVEELTLYILAQDNTINALNKRIESMESRQ